MTLNAIYNTEFSFRIKVIIVYEGEWSLYQENKVIHVLLKEPHV